MSTADDTATLWDMINDIRVCMVTSQDTDGALHSRPMAGHQDAFDGTLWFLTRAPSGKTREVDSHAEVNLAYVDRDDGRYVSVSGAAEILQDRQQVRAHWQEPARIWFPDGPDSPDLAVMKVTVHHAQYWDSPSSGMTVAYDYAKARLTGKPQTVGERRKIDLE